jgi:hypothetical protein
MVLNETWTVWYVTFGFDQRGLVLRDSYQNVFNVKEGEINFGMKEEMIYTRDERGQR